MKIYKQLATSRAIDQYLCSPMEVGKCCICFNIFAFYLTWEIWLPSTEANTFKSSGLTLAVWVTSACCGGLDFCHSALSTFLMWPVRGRNSLPSPNETPGFPKLKKTPFHLFSDAIQKCEQWRKHILPIHY